MKSEKFPDIEVWIEVDGQPLREYELPDELSNADTTKCYIVAQPGAEYSVKWRCKPEVAHPEESLLFKVLVDGEIVRGKVNGRDALARGTHEVRGRKITTNGKHFWQQLRFGTLTTDDRSTASLAHVKNRIRHLGEISVCLTRVIDVGRTSRSEQTKIVPAPGDIPEKALKGKAISTRTMFDDPLPCSRGAAVHCHYPYGREPFASYVFLYRTHHDLEIEGVIARTSTPAPVEERDPEDLTAEELQAEVRRLRAKEADRAKVKLEDEKRHRSDSVTSGAAREGDDGLFEVQASAAKKRRTGGTSFIEAIDLTGD